MSTLAAQAIERQATALDIAKAAVQDAAAGATTEAEKEALALALYKDATGRFPQDSSDRRAVYLGGFVLVGIVFLGIIAVAIVLGINNKTVPDPFWTVATALGSGVIGGLFGYAKQG